MKRYREMRNAAIKIQTWWRGILARKLVASIRKEVSAKRLQCAIRRFLLRHKFISIRNSVVMFQSCELCCSPSKKS